MMVLPGVSPGGCDVVGAGAQTLLLPALSSISTRREMLPLARLLATRLRCTVVGWPGFGDHPRARVALTPDALRGFLDMLLAGGAGTPQIGVAAGHGATCLVDTARRHPGRFSGLVLVAPTWRGPLPTMIEKSGTPLGRRVRAAIELPVVGDLLYRLGVGRPMVARMMRAHVFADAGQVTPGMLDDKLSVTRRPRARFGTAAPDFLGISKAGTRGGP